MEKCCEGKDGEEMMKKMWMHKHHHGGHGNGSVYGLGFIGAAIYFLGKATTFGAGIIGLLKSLVWPAYLVFEAFKFLLK